MRWSLAGWLAAMLWVAPAAAQPAPIEGTWAWKPLAAVDGVIFEYIFYAEADGRHNGLVMLLTNTNAHAVRYRFHVVFRSGGDEVEIPVRGRLEAGERRTGDQDGLFWIPFGDDREIGEVGLRGYRITRADPLSGR